METIFEDDEKVFYSICNGAEGYILKNTPPAQILEAIREIYDDDAPMTPGIASKILALFKSGTSFDQDKSHHLTDRETEILKYLMEGRSYKAVAEKCFVSQDAISSHVKSIYGKLHVYFNAEKAGKQLKSKNV